MEFLLTRGVAISSQWSSEPLRRGITRFRRDLEMTLNEGDLIPSGRNVVIDGVRAEIPAARVEGDVLGEKDLRRRMNAAHVLVGAEAGVFVADPRRVLNFHRARGGVHGAHGKSARLRRARERLVRGGGGEVEVRAPQGKPRKEIAHAPAHKVERKSALLRKEAQVLRNQLVQNRTFFENFPKSV